VRTLLSLLSLHGVACAPLMSAALPVPLPSEHPTAAGLGVVAPLPGLRTRAVADLPAPPVVQASAWGTVRLADRWEAGPIFLLDFREEGRQLSSGLFVRHWLQDPSQDVAVGLRIDTGWAWIGASADVRLRLSDEADLAFAPGLLAAPGLAALRAPVSGVLRLGRVDLAVEIGIGGGIHGGRLRGLGYGGARAQVAF